DISIRGARGLLLNVTGSSTMTFQDLEEATGFIREEAHEEANIIFGAAIDESLGDRFQITVIATGFSGVKEQVREVPKQERVVTQLEDVRLEKMRQEARVVKLGTIISDFADDGEYDIPTFVRRQHMM
ncbi:MAG: cell division protein FtsZ, partial [Desulfobacterota bacterium]|nr:cell division protein FtsZ [Thermodesulfobacteriota bacterium]